MNEWAGCSVCGCQESVNARKMFKVYIMRLFATHQFLLDSFAYLNKQHLRARQILTANAFVHVRRPLCVHIYSCCLPAITIATATAIVLPTYCWRAEQNILQISDEKNIIFRMLSKCFIACSLLWLLLLMLLCW